MNLSLYLAPDGTVAIMTEEGDNSLVVARVRAGEDLARRRRHRLVVYGEASYTGQIQLTSAKPFTKLAARVVAGELPDDEDDSPDDVLVSSLLVSIEGLNSVRALVAEATVHLEAAFVLLQVLARALCTVEVHQGLLVPWMISARLEQLLS